MRRRNGSKQKGLETRTVLAWRVGLGCWHGVLAWGVGLGCWPGVLVRVGGMGGVRVGKGSMCVCVCVGGGGLPHARSARQTLHLYQQAEAPPPCGLRRRPLPPTALVAPPQRPPQAPPLSIRWASRRRVENLKSSRSEFSTSIRSASSVKCVSSTWSDIQNFS